MNPPMHHTPAPSTATAAARPQGGVQARTLQRRRPGEAPRRLTRLTAASVLVTGLLLVPAASPASAAEIPSAVTSATLSTTTFGPWDGVRLDIGWAVPDSAEPGDTFTVDLPPELVPLSTVPFDLLSADGSVVAHAVWDGSSAVVTLTDYVTDRTGVQGTGFFEVQWNTALLGTDPVTTVVVVAGTSVTVTMTGPGEPGPPSPDPAKWAYWNRPDQGTTDLDEALTWEVRLPAWDTGSDGQVTVTDDLGPGQSMACSTVQVRSRSSAPDSPVVSWTDGSPERIVSLDCADDAMVLVLDEVRADEYLTLTYQVDITDAGLGAYTNEAQILTTTDSAVVGAEKERASAGGDGSGTTSVPPTTEPTDPVTTPPTPEPTPGPTDPAPRAEPTPSTVSAAPAPQEPSTPSRTAVPAAATASTPTGTGRATLASTGSSAGALVASTVVLAAAGGALVWSARRRTRSTT